uniref:Uncharacterized protein n=1 Tax=Anguilla anguilla TaxID=7936 RepID=A0A0E9XMY2_ANGAN
MSVRQQRRQFRKGAQSYLMKLPPPISRLYRLVR